MRAVDGNNVKLECHDSLPSTSKLAKTYAGLGTYPDRYVIFSDKLRHSDRTEGQVKYDEGVFMSIILRPSIFPSQGSLIPALAAASAAMVLDEHTAMPVGIGWVSNLYCNGKLIGNVKIEGKLDNFTSYEYLIVTFSIVLEKKHFPPRLTDVIKKVFEKDNSSVSMIIAKNILNRFFKFYSNLKNSSKFMNIYNKYFLMRGMSIRYTENGKRHRYKVIGIDMDSCALVVESRRKGTRYITKPANVQTPSRIITWLRKDN